MCYYFPRPNKDKIIFKQILLIRQQLMQSSKPRHFCTFLYILTSNLFWQYLKETIYVFNHAFFLLALKILWNINCQIWREKKNMTKNIQIMSLSSINSKYIFLETMFIERNFKKMRWHWSKVFNVTRKVNITLNLSNNFGVGSLLVLPKIVII